MVGPYFSSKVKFMIGKLLTMIKGHRDRKKRPGVDFFVKAILAGLTN